jgi:hypothetical protein
MTIRIRQIFQKYKRVKKRQTFKDISVRERINFFLKKNIQME